MDKGYIYNCTVIHIYKLHVKDSTGVKIFYTPKLRDHAEALFHLGQLRFYIPPNNVDYHVNAICDSNCSRKAFAQPFNLTSITFHMHATG